MAEITFDGGLNEQDSTVVDPRECVEGYNFEIQFANTHLQPRKPFEKQGTVPFDVWNINSLNYTNKFLDVLSQDSNPTALAFSQDGLNLYIAGSDNPPTVFQYTLGTAWDIDTAIYASKSIDVSAQETEPRALAFKADGKSMYIAGTGLSTGGTVYQYTLGTAWDLSTASYASKSKDVSTEESFPTGVTFKSDGFSMYIVGVENKTIYQYTLGTAWDVGTASYASKSIDVSTQDASPRDLSFKTDGLVAYIVGATNDSIYQYTLGAAWDINTASYSSKSFPISSQTTQPTGIAFKTDGTLAYVVGQIDNSVYQYEFSGNSVINGFIQLITSSGVKHTLIQSSDRVYAWDGSTTWTLKDTLLADSRLRGVNWTLGDYSVVVDLFKNSVVKKWDGTSFTTLTTGLVNPLKAKYALVHLGRVWLFNVESGVDTPHLILASAFENPESYDTSERAITGTFATGLEAFYITVPNLKPINGVALFFGTLVISTVDGVLYKLIGSDANDFEIIPYYTGSSAIGTETFANIGNDVVYMRQGVVESLRVTDTSGDVATDDISRWIRPSVSGVTDAITVYDRDRQKVYFFIGNNKVLVLFKNKIGTGLSPWSVYMTNHESSFQTNAAIHMKNPASGLNDNYVYFGDDKGNIYHMDGDINGDNGDTDIQVFRRSLYFESDQIELEGISGRVYYKRVADVDLTMQFEFGDDYSTTTCLIPLEGPPTTDNAAYWGGDSYWGGEFYWNAGFKFSSIMTTKGYSPVGKGTGIHMLLTLNTRQTFDVVKITDES